MTGSRVVLAVAIGGLLLLVAGVAISRRERAHEAAERELRERLHKTEAKLRAAERATRSETPADLRQGASLPLPNPLPGQESAEQVPPAALAVHSPDDGSKPTPSAKETERKAKGFALPAGLSRSEQIAALREMFAGTDRKLQEAALAALPALGGPEATELALAALQKEGPPWLRRKAADILAELGDPAALPALQKTFESKEAQLQVPSARALSRLGHSQPLQELTARAATDLRSPEPERREKGVEILGRIGSAEVVPQLALALVDPDPRVRKEAVEALASTRLAEAITILESSIATADPKTQEVIRKELAELRAPK